jgi:hypothetical protein
MNWLNKIWNAIRIKNEKELREEYLAQSVDMKDLERRLKLIDTGKVRFY